MSDTGPATKRSGHEALGHPIRSSTTHRWRSMRRSSRRTRPRTAWPLQEEQHGFVPDYPRVGNLLRPIVNVARGYCPPVSKATKPVILAQDWATSRIGGASGASRRPRHQWRGDAWTILKKGVAEARQTLHLR
jgi:hypothetical protein